MEAFKTRVRDALGDGSKAVEMTIKDQARDDLPSLVNQMVEQDNDSVAVSSFDIAKKLTDAQHRRDIPGGIIVVFSGSQGHPTKKFFGIIKAEIHSAYMKSNNERGEISLEFVEEVLLTPGSRLYKTAGFFEKATYDESSSDLNDKWTVMVSDYQISRTDGKAAAQYFYSDFLGCGYPQTSARTTKQFYQSTKTFISELDISVTQKSDLINALTAYLKTNTSSAISSSEFASTYFNDIDVQDAFSSHMRECGLPSVAFTKDICHIESQLSFRKVNFGSNVKITAPSDAFKNLITIETIDGDLDESGTPTEWTKVTIKDRITKQE